MFLRVILVSNEIGLKFYLESSIIKVNNIIAAMKKSILILPFLIFLFSTLTSNAQITTGSITVDGLERDYILQIPNNYVEGEAIPLVFNFHGFGSNALQQQFYAGMTQLANTKNFAICYPNGVDAAWNVGWSFGSQANDVGFVEAMIDKFSADYTINDKKIYSCGMSNGGFFSIVLACELGDKIAAIASVTGGMVDEYVPNCNPEQKIPMMQIHGTADDVVAYNGTQGVSIPVESLITLWTDKLVCTTPGDTTVIADTDMSDMTTAIRIDYTDCQDDLEVVLYKIDGGGHTWPGAPINIGVTNYDFSASEVIWEFFDRFELPVSTSTEDIDLQSLRLSPNPVSDFVLIDGIDAAANVEVYSMQGIQVINQTTHNGMLRLSGLDAGVYILKIVGTDQVAKFIKL